MVPKAVPIVVPERRYTAILLRFHGDVKVVVVPRRGLLTTQFIM